MSREPPPVLSAASVLWISREGGVAHFPGQARPRRILCAGCDEAERHELQRLLETLAAAASEGRQGADRRTFKVEVEDVQAGHWCVEIDESRAPVTLTRLWQRSSPGAEEGG